MKVQIDDYGTKREYNSLEQYALLKLDGDDYGMGAVEAVTVTARQNSEAIGRLLDLMTEKGLISIDDAIAVIKGY